MTQRGPRTPSVLVNIAQCLRGSSANIGRCPLIRVRAGAPTLHTPVQPQTRRDGEQLRCVGRRPNDVRRNARSPRMR